jgi:hypothetical protein
METLIAGEGRINGPLRPLSSDVHHCFASHVLHKFRSDLPNDEPPPECFPACPGSLEVSSLPSASDSPTSSSFEYTTSASGSSSSASASSAPTTSSASPESFFSSLPESSSSRETSMQNSLAHDPLFLPSDSESDEVWNIILPNT